MPISSPLRASRVLADLSRLLTQERGAVLGDEPVDEGLLREVPGEVLAQLARMADYLQLPLTVLAKAFDWSSLLRQGSRFHKLPAPQQLLHAAKWRQAGLGPQRDFIRLVEALTTFAYESAREAEVAAPPPSDDLPVSLPKRAQTVVIGSGPGGAITAALLAEAGRQVVLLEEGPDLPLESCAPFSRQEMLQKYRHAGLSAALGRPKVAYVEGRCVGGGSEINSGLYHRTPPEILERWRNEFQAAECREEDLAPHFEACERDVNVCTLPGPASPTSQRLHQGALRLGWKSLEVPRWFQYDGTSDVHGRPRGTRRSMSKTFVPRFRSAGGLLASGARVLRLRRIGGRWRVSGRRASGEPFTIEAETVFVAGGAVQTPALLRRSGVAGLVGRTLQLHPMVKLIAEFEDEVNSSGLGVGVHQVKQFAPRISLGCSISSPPYLALSFLDHPHAGTQLRSRWQHQSIVYASLCGEGRGTVTTLPGYRDPLVRYRLTDRDLRDLADGLKHLAHCALAAGAVTLYPCVAGLPVMHSPADVLRLPEQLTRDTASLMTIHLTSSCAMGENRARCAVDSFGRVHGVDDLYVADASLLCTAPAVNPQGSIMALARRNALEFLR